MPGLRLHILLMLILGFAQISLPAFEASNAPISSFQLGSSLMTTKLPAQIQGTITLLDSARKLFVLQDGNDVVALYSDLTRQGLRVGDRVELEGRIEPLISACPGFPQHPDGRQIRDLFEAPLDWGDFFLSRLRGRLHPPVSGDYTFWIASDDSSELWLSDSEDPAGARKIAQIGNGQWTPSRVWTRSTSQQSRPIRLEAGKAYYLEAIGQDTRSRDCLAVAWQGPGFERTVIDGKFASPVPIQGGESGLQRPGVLWEYWTNFFASDFSVLRVTNEHILKFSDVRVLKSEKGEWPAPFHIRLGQQINSQANFRLVELEGYVNFLSKLADGWLIELRHGNSRITVRIKSNSFPGAVIPNDSLIRVRGVFEPAEQGDSELPSGTVWAGTDHDITWLDTEDNWSPLEPMAQHLLTSLNPDLPTGRIVRAQGRVMAEESSAVWRVQGKDTFQGYTSTDGTNWLALGVPIEVQMSNSVLVGIAIASPDADEVVRVAFDRVTGLSSALAGAEIGGRPENPRYAGEFHFKDGNLTVQGKGHHIWSKQDICYFANQPMNGNLEVVVRLAELKTEDALAKVALMIRESVSSDSPWAGIVLMNGDRVGMHSRWEAASSTTGWPAYQYLSEKWIKLVRTQNSFLVHTRADSVAPGQMLDVIGVVAWQGNRLVLDQARTRILPKLLEVATAESPTLQPFGEVREVQVSELRSEAQKAQKVAHLIPLRIQGVMTFNGPLNGEWFSFVQDDSGAVRVQWKADTLARTSRVGDWVELTGTASLTGLAAEFLANGVTTLGGGAMPEPVRFATVAPRGIRAVGQWTELEGVVRTTARDGTLRVKATTGLFEVRAGNGRPLPANMVNALIRVRGVLWLAPNPLLLLPSEQFIEILEAPPADPFDIPTFSIHSLLTNNPAIVRRLKVSGVVTCRRKDFIVVQDETGGIRAETTALPNMEIGATVEVVGFPVQRGFGMTLSEVLLHPTHQHGGLEPIPVSADNIIQPQNNGVLVSVEAVLLDHNFRDDRQMLDVQVGQRAFQASLPIQAGELPAIAVGSRLRLTGVAVVSGAETSPVSVSAQDGLLTGSLELLLRHPRDVIVVERPPWWNWKYTVATCGVTLGVFVGAVIWIRTLRQRVEERTHELRETMGKLERETKISATLAERDRLAGEIHDSIEQGLSAIMMQLATAERLTDQPEEIKRYVIMAKNMASFSRTEVQHAVWDMQSPLLENADLPRALRRVAREISSDDTPRVEVEISGTVFPLPSATEHHLLRIAQEAITNAVKHGNPKTIFLALKYESDRVTLTVQDDGAGFDLETVSTERGHFGLQGMRSRAQKLDADLILKSKPGAGTSLKIMVRSSTGVSENGEDGKVSLT
jgi:signal transduction histidine kinase